MEEPSENNSKDPPESSQISENKLVNTENAENTENIENTEITDNVEIKESQQSLSKGTSTVEITENVSESIIKVPSDSSIISDIEDSNKSDHSEVSQSVANTTVAESTVSIDKLSSRLKKTHDSRENKGRVVSSEIEPTIRTIPKNPLEDLNDGTLIETVEQLQKNVKCLAMESTVFMHFLEKNEPSLLGGMDTTLSKAQIKSDRTSVSMTRKLTLTRYSRRESTLLWNPPSAMTLFSGDTPISLDREGPRINLTQKTDLLLREMEEIKTQAEIVEAKYYKARHKLNAELEEMAVRESELRATLELFENVFINCTIERYTQSPNPAEKFCRFMEEWFKQSRLTIDKIRLRTSSLRVQYQKTCNQLIQKRLLGANLQEVDFEQLHIENKHLRMKIDQRNILLLEMKKMHGKANLLLSQIKKQLLKKTNDLKAIKDDIKDKEEKIIKFDEDCERVSLELDNMKTEYDSIKLKTETYQVPPVLEYVKTKAEVEIFRKNLKIWLRRKQLKEVALNAAIKEMKIATGQTAPQPFWFIDPRHTQSGRASLESTFYFKFERQKSLPVMAHIKKKLKKKP